MTTRTETSSRSSQHAAREGGRAEKAQDAIALLKSDHRHVEELFEQFESARKPERKQEIVQNICMELTVHAELEESSFYPVVREALSREDDLLDEALVEHSSLKWLIGQLEGEAPDSELYEAKVTVLKEYVQHHVKEEERQLFPKVRKSSLDTGELGQTLQAVKEELQQKMMPH